MRDNERKRVREREKTDNGNERAKRETIEKGEKKARIDRARSLLSILDFETISKKTGLSVGEIEGLKKDE